MKQIHIHLHARGMGKTTKVNDSIKDASEEISISKVLAKFPDLKAFGLSKVTYMNGQVYIVSTYEIPRDKVSAVETFVKTIKTI